MSYTELDKSTVHYRPPSPTTTGTVPALSTDDRGVVIACALSSVAMVCLIGAMLHFRSIVLRREKACREMLRLRTTVQRSLKRASSTPATEAAITAGERPTSATISPVRSIGGSRPGSAGSAASTSFRRHSSYPPDPKSELRRDSLHSIPNGFGARATIEPRHETVTVARPSPAPTRPDFTRQRCASSSPRDRIVAADSKQKTGVFRRSSWSFDNPVFDRHSSPRPNLDSLDYSNDLYDDDSDDNIFIIDPEPSEIIVEGKNCLNSTKAKDGGVMTVRKFQKLHRFSEFGPGINPLYNLPGDERVLPTLHEREDSTSSGGNTEKATENEPTHEVNSDINSNVPILDLSRLKSESRC